MSTTTTVPVVRPTVILSFRGAHTKHACQRVGGVWRKGTRHRAGSCAKHARRHRR